MLKNLIFLLLISTISKAQIIKGDITYYIDHTTKKGLYEVFESNQFIIAKNNIPSLGINPKPVWTKIKIKNTSAYPQKIFAQIQIPFIDTVQYFIVKNKNIVLKSEKMGWWAILKNRDFPNPNHSYNFILDASQTVEVYAKIIKTHGTVRVPLRIDTEKEYFYEMLRKREFWGWFVGMGFVVISLNLFLYFLLKDKVYLYYTLYVFSQIFNLDCMEGIHSELYMNGLSSISGRSVYYFSMILIVISNVLFINSYLKVKEIPNQIFYKITQVLILISLIFAILIAIPESIMVSITTQKVFIWVFTACYFISAGFTISLIFYSIYINHERKAAYLYLVAGFPLFIVGFMQILGNMQVLPIQSAQRSNNIIIAIAFEILVLCLWLAMRFKVYTEEREKLLQERKKQQQKALEDGLKLQNQERSRLAKELHDGVGIDISIVKMKLESLKIDLDKKGFETHELNETMGNLDTVSSEIRSFSHNLMPPDLETNGIANVLQNLVINLQKVNPKIEINFTTNIEEKIPNDLSQNLFFIAKELLNNALKHANASIIDIELMNENKQIELRIADNGKGFDFKNVIENGGLGLRSIQSRVELMKADFKIQSKPAGGILHHVIFK